MPVSREIAENNRVQRERLTNLVRNLDDAGLRTRLPNGWTVAGALGHLTFWDRQRLCLIRRWAAGDVRSGAYDSDVFNDAVQPLLDMIPPAQIAAAAVKAAEEVDALLLDLPDQMIQETLARPDAPHLNRGEHRGHHLDQIEKALAPMPGPLRASGRTAVEVSPDAAEVRRIIEGHNANAVRAYAAGDADSIAKMVAEDAWQMPPNAPPLVGREAIRSFWRDALRWGSWEFDLQTQNVEVNGPLAIERGKYRLRFTAKPEAPPSMASFEDSGNYVVLWRRESDGEWRGVWDAPVSERPLVPTTTARDERAALLQRDRDWAAAASEGKDVERILSFWTDDAKVFPVGLPVVDGKQAIREFVTGSLSTPGFHISWEPEEAVVTPSGDMGYTTGRNHLTMPDAAGNLQTESGRGVAVWRREPDGVWRCVIDIWNSGP